MAKYVNNNWEKHRLPIGHIDEKVGKEILFRTKDIDIIVLDKKAYKEKQKEQANLLVWFVLFCLWIIESIYFYQLTPNHNYVLWFIWSFLFLIILTMLLLTFLNLKYGSHKRVNKKINEV